MEPHLQYTLHLNAVHKSGFPLFYLDNSSEGALYVLRSFDTTDDMCKYWREVHGTCAVLLNDVITVY